MAMLDHISLGVSDLAASGAFCDAAFVLDPDGHKIEALCRGAA
jgi:catechol 2,3-dioxygenase-like lactoylglutathione lyase family enzyme